jgi:hypothetical protein
VPEFLGVVVPEELEVVGAIIPEDAEGLPEAVCASAGNPDREATPRVRSIFARFVAFMFGFPGKGDKTGLY